MEWISVEDRLPTKADGWIGYTMDRLGKEKYYIRVLAFETGGYGKRVVIRQFFLLLIGEWTTDNDECEIATGSFMDGEFADWTVTHWMPLPQSPESKDKEEA